MRFAIEFDREDDGRWIAEIHNLPGVMVYGVTQLEAKSKVEALALRVLADRIERSLWTSGRPRLPPHEPLAGDKSFKSLPGSYPYRLD